jgi:hypothetical protein
LPLTLADPLNDKDVAGLINDTGRFLIVYGIVEYQSTGGESYFSTFGCRTAGGFNTLRTYGKWTTAK